MPKIGQFTRTPSGFVGRLHTLTLDVEIAILAEARGDNEHAPDYRVRLGGEDGPEIGAGWERTGERAGSFVALLIDDPIFAQPLRANLFRDDEAGHAWLLHWNRPQRRDGRD